MSTSTETATPEVGDFVTLRADATCHGTDIGQLQIVRRDPLGDRPARVIEVREVTNDERGTFQRVTLEWWGLDTSGHFAERRHAFALASDCLPVR